MLTITTVMIHASGPLMVSVMMVAVRDATGMMMTLEASTHTMTTTTGTATTTTATTISSPLYATRVPTVRTVADRRPPTRPPPSATTRASGPTTASVTTPAPRAFATRVRIAMTVGRWVRLTSRHGMMMDGGMMMITIGILMTPLTTGTRRRNRRMRARAACSCQSSRVWSTSWVRWCAVVARTLPSSSTRVSRCLTFPRSRTAPRPSLSINPRAVRTCPSRRTSRTRKSCPRTSEHAST
mmetsp:Transcript_75985/g.216878  ORF Transcript_75985/g.216878 Transcript_75985/m.216878 type:complete len:240 (+) Transcript_75985:2074-2793(+)